MDATPMSEQLHNWNLLHKICHKYLKVFIMFTHMEWTCNDDARVWSQESIVPIVARITILLRIAIENMVFRQTLASILIPITLL
jgi:hypothetical protein